MSLSTHPSNNNNNNINKPSHQPANQPAKQATRWYLNFFFLSYQSRSLADRWGTTVDFTTSFLHSSRFSAFRSMIFHSRPVHSLMLSSHLNPTKTSSHAHFANKLCAQYSSFSFYRPHLSLCAYPYRGRLVGLVVKASTSRSEDPGFDSR